MNGIFKNVSTTPLFRCCSRAYIKREFDKYLADLNMINPDIMKYLINVGKEKWSRHHFPNMRYEIITINISESYNDTIRVAREMLITMLFE